MRGGAITIGNFDGVHRGHAALLTRVRQRADQLGGPALAVVFDPHPAVILRPESAPARLTELDRRAELLDRCGIDYLIVCETTKSFLKMSAETFFDTLVRDRLAARGVVEGPNFFFGHRRSGNVELLETLCGDASIELEIVPPLRWQPAAAAAAEGSNGPADSTLMISSTRIRELIRAGELDAANELLGHPHQLRGDVVRGRQRGRTLGFPTANLSGIKVLLPQPGVYGGLAEVGDDRFSAAIHIGPRPTFHVDQDATVEVHLLDFAGDLYGNNLRVDVVTHVRETSRFESADELAAQLSNDVAVIRERLASRQKPSH